MALINFKNKINAINYFYLISLVFKGKKLILLIKKATDPIYRSITRLLLLFRSLQRLLSQKYIGKRYYLLTLKYEKSLAYLSKF